MSSAPPPRKVVITDWGFSSLDPERLAFAQHGITLEAHQCRTEEEVAAVVADADVVMTQWAPVKQTAIGAMSRCRGIVRYGIGLDNVDLEAARQRGITVRNVPDYCLHEVADHTLALILSLQRQVCRVHDLVRGGTWKIVPPLQLPPLRESRLGLIGFGRIARLVAARAQAFGMHVMAADRYVEPAGFMAHQVEPCDLDRLFHEADIISLHCPLTPETQHLINAVTLQQMKPSALLVNTSRGGLIDTAALIEALRAGTIGGAGLDVFEQEPLPEDSGLRELPGVILNSHISWYSGASVGELQRLAAQAAVELVHGVG